jgi:hypothetical protein
MDYSQVSFPFMEWFIRTPYFAMLLCFLLGLSIGKSRRKE